MAARRSVVVVGMCQSWEHDGGSSSAQDVRPHEPAARARGKCSIAATCAGVMLTGSSDPSGSSAAAPGRADETRTARARAA